MKSASQKLTKYLFFLIVFLSIIFFIRNCVSSFGYTDQEIYTSPQETNTIVVKYDFVCRPDVFKKGWLWDKKIWDYPNSGFMESVHFGVEWLSENQIRLGYKDVKHDKYDEEFIITIPD